MRLIMVCASALVLVAACDQFTSNSAEDGAPAAVDASSGAAGETGEAATAGAAPPVIDERAMRARAQAIETLRRQLADPDPNVQLAAMEAAVATGDATARQLALQVGFASADQGLRAAALSHYFAGNPTITINISPVPEYAAAVAEVEQARARQQNRELSAYWNEYISNLDGIGRQVTIEVRNFDRATGAFSFNVRDRMFQERIDQDRFPQGTLSGETLSLNAQMNGSEGHVLTLRATLSLSEGGILRGSASGTGSPHQWSDFTASPVEARVF